MASLPQSPNHSQPWSPEAMAMAAQAKVLSGNKLEQLVVRLQRHSGRPKEAWWRFPIQPGIKGQQDHRRWTETEFEIVREELVKRSIEEVARKVNRTLTPSLSRSSRSLPPKRRSRAEDERCQSSTQNSEESESGLVFALPLEEPANQQAPFSLRPSFPQSR